MEIQQNNFKQVKDLAIKLALTDLQSTSNIYERRDKQKFQYELIKTPYKTKEYEDILII